MIEVIRQLEICCIESRGEKYNIHTCPLLIRSGVRLGGDGKHPLAFYYPELYLSGEM